MNSYSTFKLFKILFVQILEAYFHENLYLQSFLFSGKKLGQINPYSFPLTHEYFTISIVVSFEIPQFILNFDNLYITDYFKISLLPDSFLFFFEILIYLIASSKLFFWILKVIKQLPYRLLLVSQHKQFIFVFHLLHEGAPLELNNLLA